MIEYSHDVHININTLKTPQSTNINTEKNKGETVRT